MLSHMRLSTNRLVAISSRPNSLASYGHHRQARLSEWRLLGEVTDLCKIRGIWRNTIHQYQDDAAAKARAQVKLTSSRFIQPKQCCVADVAMAWLGLELLIFEGKLEHSRTLVAGLILIIAFFSTFSDTPLIASKPPRITSSCRTNTRYITSTTMSAPNIDSLAGQGEFHSKKPGAEPLTHGGVSPTPCASCKFSTE